MTPTERPSRRVAILAVLAAACWGCGGGGDGFEHYAVNGTIRHDGDPLKSGTITFVPGGPGAAGTAEIVDGAFAIDAADGLSPGEYRVEIYSIQPTGRKIENADDPGAKVDETVNRVDRSFNVDSTLKVTVPPGGFPGPLAFDVTSPNPAAKKKRR
ncbi:hypothetical protein [Paludisphaera soli]|uniref:hypothetical protein n=1 Tax=Paludisphaera soli TaxID=2712865 RepID=UPI0013EC3AE7|nr:hypothetical protein [Paludisphaera soli]